MRDKFIAVVSYLVGGVVGSLAIAYVLLAITFPAGASDSIIICAPLYLLVGLVSSIVMVFALRRRRSRPVGDKG